MPIRVFPLIEQNNYYSEVDGIEINNESLAIGNNSVVSHDGAIALGADSFSKRENELSMNVNPAGDNFQKARMILANFFVVTDSISPTKEMALRNGEFTIDVGTSVAFKLIVNAVSDSGMAKSWECKGMIINDPVSGVNVYPVPPVVNLIGASSGTGSWSISASASTSGNDRLIISVTGDSVEDTRFHAILIGSELIL